MPETIYDALHESHEIQRSLCRRLLRSKPHTESRQAFFQLSGKILSATQKQKAAKGYRRDYARMLAKLRAE